MSAKTEAAGEPVDGGWGKRERWKDRRKYNSNWRGGPERLSTEEPRMQNT